MGEKRGELEDDAFAAAEGPGELIDDEEDVGEIFVGGWEVLRHDCGHDRGHSCGQGSDHGQR
jgi:hypothetical protein